MIAYTGLTTGLESPTAVWYDDYYDYDSIHASVKDNIKDFLILENAVKATAMMILLCRKYFQDVSYLNIVIARAFFYLRSMCSLSGYLPKRIRKKKKNK